MPAFAVGLLLVSAIACDRTAATVDDASLADGSTMDDARMPDAMMADAMMRDAMVDAPVPARFVSNTPNAAVVDIGTPPTPEIMLLSSNLLQRPRGPLDVQQEWVGEFRNVGSGLVCAITPDVTFKSAAGVETRLLDTRVASAEPYQSRSTPLARSVACVRPGEIGGFRIEKNASSEVRLDAVTTIEVKFIFFTSRLGDFVPAPHRPLLVSQVAPVLSELGVAGTLTGQTAAIHDIRINIFPRAANGLVLGRLTATAVDTLDPGETTSFTSTTLATSFTEYRAFVEFADSP